MNKTLLIEVKDNSTIVTLVGYINNRWSILLSKKYYYDFNNNIMLSTEKNINYNIAWMESMVEDIEKLFSIKEIENTFLTINNSYSLLSAYKLKTNTSTTSKEAFNELFDVLVKNNKNLKILDITLDDSEATPINNYYSFSYEVVNKDLWNTLINYLKSFGINVTKVISSKTAIETALKPYIDRSKYLYNVQIEDKFMALHLIKDKKFVQSRKINLGLNYIYQKISKTFNINTETARKLFEKYGNIPPQAIIDNRVIFDGYDNNQNKIYFSKKDLSAVITKCVNDIFKDIKQTISSLQIVEPEIVFSGKIARLKGFEKYAKETLNIKVVNIFKTNIIGLELKTEIITIGILHWLEKNISAKSVETKDKKDTTKVYKKRGVVNMIFSKFNKYYNYV